MYIEIFIHDLHLTSRSRILPMLQPSVAKHVDLALFFLGKYDPTKLRVVLSTKLLPRPIRILYVKKSRCGEGTKLEARRPMLHRMVPMMAMIR